MKFEATGEKRSAAQLDLTADGGEGRTRTFEAMRRLIYSQLPLPLGTLPRFTPHRKPSRLNARDQADDDAESRKTFIKASAGRVYGRRAMAKSTNVDSENANIFRASVKLPAKLR